MQDRMDLLPRKQGASQADKRHDKSNPVSPTQRTGFCGAEMTRTEEFIEGLEGSLGTEGGGSKDLFPMTH